MKHLLTLSAIIETGAGLALLFAPSPAVSLLLGVPLELPIALTIGRVAAVALLALAVACLMARSESGRAARGVVAGMLAYNVGITAVMVHAATVAGLQGVGLWPAVGLHTVLSGWCVVCLVKSRKQRSPSSGRV